MEHQARVDQWNREPQTYILCFAHNPVGHSKHYIGRSTNVASRCRKHARGTSRARLMEELHQRGGTFRIAAILPGDHERELKRQKNAPRLCPLCNPRALSLPPYAANAAIGKRASAKSEVNGGT